MVIMSVVLVLVFALGLAWMDMDVAVDEPLAVAAVGEMNVLDPLGVKPVASPSPPRRSLLRLRPVLASRSADEDKGVKKLAQAASALLLFLLFLLLPFEDETVVSVLRRLNMLE